MLYCGGGGVAVVVEALNSHAVTQFFLLSLTVTIHHTATDFDIATTEMC